MSEQQTAYNLKPTHEIIELSEANKVLDNFPVNTNFSLINNISLIRRKLDPRLIKSGNKGHLYLIIGCMYSGKTTRLIKLINQALDNGLKFQVFKPKIDNRYIENKVNSHDKITADCELINDSSYFSSKVNLDTDIVFIDEIQFLDVNIVFHIEKLIELGKVVVCTGLNLDFKIEAFNTIRDLLPIADYIDKFSSICYKCGNVATLTQRLINNEAAGYYDPVVLVGSESMYKAVCRSCHELRK